MEKRRTPAKRKKRVDTTEKKGKKRRKRLGAERGYREETKKETMNKVFEKKRKKRE